MEFTRGRLKVVLDKSQVFPEDPGQGTPAMVYFGNHSGSYYCAVATGLVDDHELTQEQVAWLDGLGEKIHDYLYQEHNGGIDDEIED